MFEIKTAVKAALKERAIAEIISSSWRSTRQQFPLPAIVIDLSNVTPSERTEDGAVLTWNHELHVAAHVSLNGVSDDEAEQNLESLVDNFEQTIKAAFGDNYTIHDWYPMSVPFGTSQALCGAFALTIET